MHYRKRINEKQTGCLFLDIELYDDNGFEIAKYIKEDENPPAIVFAIAYDRYALQALKVDALDYILKLINEEYSKTLKEYKKQKQIKLETNQDVKSVEM